MIFVRAISIVFACNKYVRPFDTFMEVRCGPPPSKSDHKTYNNNIMGIFLRPPPMPTPPPKK